MDDDTDDLRMLRKQPQPETASEPARAAINYNNNWVGAGMLLAIVFVPHMIHWAWGTFATEALVASAIFFLIGWRVVSGSSAGRHTLAATWHLAGIMLTADLVGLVRLLMGYVLGGKAVQQPSDLLNVLFSLVLPIALSIGVAILMKRKLATPPRESVG